MGLLLERVTWTSPPLAGFQAMMCEIELRFGPPTARDLDSNGIGLFDCHLLRFECGLEVALWRFHLRYMREFDPLIAPSQFELHANQRDLEHIGFHLGVAPAAMDRSYDQNGDWLAPPVPHCFQVLRQDIYMNAFLVRTASSECEAEAVAEEYQRRGHHQTYWVSRRGR